MDKHGKPVLTKEHEKTEACTASAAGMSSTSRRRYKTLAEVKAPEPKVEEEGEVSDARTAGAKSSRATSPASTKHTKKSEY